MKGADLGHQWCKQRLGDIYLNGYGVNKDVKESIRWYSEAAKQGNMQSLVNVITLTSFGDGADKDRFEWALSLLENYADNGDTDAIYKLGTYYYTGSGVEKDLDKARSWYMKGADLGHRDSIEMLEKIAK